MDSMEETKDYNNSSSCCNNTTNNDGGAHAIVKGKRKKRRRLHLPAPVSAVEGPTTSPASSAEFSSGITEEDEDMANCLLLLSRGRNADSPIRPELPEEKGIGTSRWFTEAKPGLYSTVYECKTCNKCFPSFQALGGHRASHKKPQMEGPVGDKKPVVFEQDGSVHISISYFSKPAAVAPSDGNYNYTISNGSTNRSRVHECNICGSEFSSGQALGGHMRRHRPIAATLEAAEIKKEKNLLLSLDLNLPALPPADDDPRELPTLTFASKDSSRLFS